MQMKPTKKPDYFLKVARGLIRLGEHVPLARRYLSIDARDRVFGREARRVRAAARRGNPLADVGFTMPLSVAGQDSSVVVRAEALLLAGIPVALERDARGRHRGTPLDELADALFAETGQPRGPLDVLTLYRDFARAGSPAHLAAHDDPRVARIPRLRRRLRVERRRLEVELRRAVRTPDVARFAATVSTADLAVAVQPFRGRERLLLGFRDRQLCVQGRERFRAVSGHGTGLAVVRAADVWELLSHAGTLLAFEFHEGGWAATTDSADGRSWSFQYHPAKP